MAFIFMFKRARRVWENDPASLHIANGFSSWLPCLQDEYSMEAQTAARTWPIHLLNVAEEDYQVARK